jgi:hypothetical protein
LNVERTLAVAGTLLLVLGVWLRFAPVSLPSNRAAQIPFTEIVPAGLALDAAAPRADSIATSNIFSKQRTPPAVRFTPAGAPHAPRVATRDRGIRLYGITMGPQGAVALIRDDAVAGGAEVYHVGDLVGGARLVAITDSTVTLERRSGPLVLYLPTGKRAAP